MPLTGLSSLAWESFRLSFNIFIHWLAFALSLGLFLILGAIVLFLLQQVYLSMARVISKAHSTASLSTWE